MNFNRANLPEETDPKYGGVVPAAQSVPAARDLYSVGAYGPGGYGPGVEGPSSFQLDLLEYLRIADQAPLADPEHCCRCSGHRRRHHLDEDAALYVERPPAD